MPASPSSRITLSSPVRLAIIGCGNVLTAYRATIDKLRAAGRAEATWACGRPAQEQDVRRLLGPVGYTCDAAELLSREDVDLVLILTSMNEHASLAAAALRAGKHVLLEKPPATSLADATALLATARASDRHLVCAPFTTLSPTFQTIAARIRAGDIGQPFSARARYGWSGPWWSEWFYKPGGGCLFDLGVYCFTTLTGLLGPARRVSAMAGVAIPERQVSGRTIKVEAEDNAQVILDFGGSTFGVVTTGFTLQQYRSPAVELYGASGTIQMLGDDWDPDGYELWQNRAGCWQVFKETEPDWSWTDGLTHLVNCLETGTEPLVRPEHARHVLEIMLNAQRSAREGRVVELETTFEPPPLAHASAEAAHLVHDRTRRH